MTRRNLISLTQQESDILRTMYNDAIVGSAREKLLAKIRLHTTVKLEPEPGLTAVGRCWEWYIISVDEDVILRRVWNDEDGIRCVEIIAVDPAKFADEFEVRSW